MLRLTIIFLCTFLLSCNTLTEGSKPLKKALQMTTTNLIGKQYSMQDQEYLDLHYDRKYSDSGSKFITTYQTYNPNSGEAIHKITVVYDTVSQEIKVNVKAVFGGVFAPDDLNYKLKVTNEFKTLESWGHEGFYRKMVGTGVPYETLVQFATEDFTYINLLEVMSEDNGGKRYWYFLDKPIKDTTSKE